VAVSFWSLNKRILIDYVRKTSVTIVRHQPEYPWPDCPAWTLGNWIEFMHVILEWEILKAP